MEAWEDKREVDDTRAVATTIRHCARTTHFQDVGEIYEGDDANWVEFSFSLSKEGRTFVVNVTAA